MTNMNTQISLSDFPLSFVSREAEISQASDVAAANEHVHRFFEVLMRDGVYCLKINGENIVLEGPKDVDVAYRLFLASPKENQDERRKQAKTFFRQGKLHRTAA